MMHQAKSLAYQMQTLNTHPQSHFKKHSPKKSDIIYFLFFQTHISCVTTCVKYSMSSEAHLFQSQDFFIYDLQLSKVMAVYDTIFDHFI